jgi:hypothetical protein
MIDLHSVVCSGTPVVWCDLRVARLAAYDASGRLIVDVLVSNAGVRDWADTDAGKAILAALRDGPLTAGELARRSGFSGGWYRTVRRGLLDAGRIIRVGPRYQLSADRPRT